MVPEGVSACVCGERERREECARGRRGAKVHGKNAVYIHRVRRRAGRLTRGARPACRRASRRVGGGGRQAAAESAPAAPTCSPRSSAIATAELRGEGEAFRPLAAGGRR